MHRVPACCPFKVEINIGLEFNRRTHNELWLAEAIIKQPKTIAEIRIGLDCWWFQKLVYFGCWNLTFFTYLEKAYVSWTWEKIFSPFLCVLVKYNWQEKIGWVPYICQIFQNNTKYESVKVLATHHPSTPISPLVDHHPLVFQPLDFSTPPPLSHPLPPPTPRPPSHRPNQPLGSLPPLFTPPHHPLAEFCVHFWSLFYGHNHLVLSNSIRHTNMKSRKKTFLGTRKGLLPIPHGYRKHFNPL